MPFQPFSWSMRRREMYARCPRAYFYHYYGSAGGAFINCTTLNTRSRLISEVKRGRKKE